MKKLFILVAVFFSMNIISAQENNANNYRIKQNDGITKFLSNNGIIIPLQNENFKTSPKVITTYNQETHFLHGGDSVTNKTIEKPNNYIRSNYIYMTIGAIEPIALGFGFQINSDLAFGIKFCGYFLSGGSYALNSGLGVGLRISKHIQFGFINIVNSEITMLNRTSDSRSSGIFIRGAALDINTGNENILSKGLHFIWSVGVVGSFAYRLTPLFSPNLKIGFNINF